MAEERAEGQGRPLHLQPGVHPTVIMEDVLEKLKLSNYEATFCKEHDLQPFSRSYFAVAQLDAQEQFYNFALLVTWILKSLGRKVNPPTLYDEPTATATRILFDIQALGFVTDFPASKLKFGHGDAVCAVLNTLMDVLLAQKALKLQQPVYPSGEEYAEMQEEEMTGAAVVDDDVLDELGDSDDDVYEESYYGGAKTGDSGGERESPIVGGDERKSLSASAKISAISDVDPEQWRAELERVLPRLKVRVMVDAKDWRSHISQTHHHFSLYLSLLPTLHKRLDRMSEEISRDLDKIQRREKSLAGQFEAGVGEYRRVKGELRGVSEEWAVRQEGMSGKLVELQMVTEELEEIKSKTDDRGNLMTDTSPLVRIKEAQSRLKQEIREMEVRIGVLQHTLMQAKVRQRSAMQSGGRKKKGALADSEDESGDPLQA